MALPVGDLNPTRRMPVVTVALIAANVAVFVLFNLQLSEGQFVCFVYRWAAVPAELFSLDVIQPGQAPVQPPCLPEALAAKDVLVSAVTSMFLHAGWGHLLFNMLFLWVFGNNVEDALGQVAFALYYLLGGLVAVYSFALANPDAATPLLGASGAVAAVLGGYLVLFPRARVQAWVPFPLYLLAAVLPGVRIIMWLFVFAIVDLPAWLMLGFWFATQVLALDTSVGDAVAYEAHIGGFVVGVLATLALRGAGVARPRRPPRHHHYRAA